MKGRKVLRRKMPKRNNTYGLLARRKAWESLSPLDKAGAKRPGSNSK